jgi:hypothetical protein
VAQLGSFPFASAWSPHKKVFKGNASFASGKQGVFCSFSRALLLRVLPKQTSRGLTSNLTCTDNQDMCDFWITSFLLGAFASQANAQQGNFSPVGCPPGGVTATQARLIVEKYMRDHPDDLHLPAQDIVFAASQLAFPCTRFAPMMPMLPER